MLSTVLTLFGGPANNVEDWLEAAGSDVVAVTPLQDEFFYFFAPWERLMERSFKRRLIKLDSLQTSLTNTLTSAENARTLKEEHVLMIEAAYTP